MCPCPAEPRKTLPHLLGCCPALPACFCQLASSSSGHGQQAQSSIPPLTPPCQPPGLGHSFSHCQCSHGYSRCCPPTQGTPSSGCCPHIFLTSAAPSSLALIPILCSWAPQIPSLCSSSSQGPALALLQLCPFSRAWNILRTP